MIAEDTSYRGFACPQVTMDEPFAELVVVEHARQMVQKFIEGYASQLQRHSEGLMPLLAGGLRRDETFETTWNLAFGEVRAALLLKKPEDAERCAVALALRLHQCGYLGDWELHLHKQARFRFDQWLLPLGDAIRVSTTPEAVSIHTRTANLWQKLTFQRNGNGWEATDAQGLPMLSRGAIRWIVLTAESLPGVAERLVENELYNYKNMSLDTDVELLLRTSDAAVSLLAEFADIYLEWVSQVVRFLIPLPVKGGMLNSGSDELCPGVICVSNQKHRINLAEILVHEATHQYFHILQRLGPLHDGTDRNLYFSPVRGTGRPISAILIAYHAFGNVLLFYRMARARALPADQDGLDIAKRMKQLEQQLETLEKALQTTTALTPLGRALWEPLYERIHD